jgi:hypothetical protein
LVTARLLSTLRPFGIIGRGGFTRSDEQIRDNWTANQNHDNCECMTDSFAHALLPGTID